MKQPSESIANGLYRAAGVATAGTALFLALAGQGCGKQPEHGGFPPALVNVTTALGRDVPIYLDEIGKANASEMVQLMPQVAGRVESLHFGDGADLKKGQPLFTIDARPFAAVLAQAQGQLARDEAAAANADHFLNRQSDIYKQGFVSPSDYDTALFNSKAAKAALLADQATIEAAKLNVEYCDIRSPIDGRAGARLVDPGNVVKINETPMLVIQRFDPIYADFTINERELPNVRAHMTDHTLKTVVKLPTETGEGREGNLTFLDNAVQDASGTIKLRATLPNADRRFWPGQFVNVRLVLAIEKSVVVPTSATQLGQQGPYIYVVKPDMTADIRPVVLGQQQGDTVVVKSGVSAGEQVIINGQLLVFPGGKVRIDTAPAPSAMGPQPGTAMDSPSTGTTRQSPPTTGIATPATSPTFIAPTTLPASEPAVNSLEQGGGKKP